VVRVGLAALAGCALVRGFGLEAETPIAALVAFTPYVAAASLVPLAVSLVLRRWWEVAVAAVLVAVFAGFVVPRALPPSLPGGTPASPRGDPLRVLALNLRVGEAAAEDVVALVRRERPDVLALTELTADSVTRLDAAGLPAALPYRSLQLGPLASGTGLFARYPLEGGHELNVHTTFHIAVAVLRRPAGDVEVVAAHASPPLPGWTTRRWARDLQTLPAAPREGPVRVIAGDLNATLDHALLRRLIGTGYRDAASARGRGLVPTWPVGRAVPRVTIDHVLVDRRAAVRSFATFSVAGTDHRAVRADLVMPG
jgi:endonuclease/exonuclease/phosphatase (EEP) superfamily protein YafD